MAIKLQQGVDATKNLRYKVRTRYTSINLDFSRISDNRKRALSYLNAVVVRDSNPYAPILTGNMRASAIERTDYANGPVVWQTEYAKEQYYNHKTKSKWFESAKTTNYKKWEKGVRTIIGKR